MCVCFTSPCLLPQCEAALNSRPLQGPGFGPGPRWRGVVVRTRARASGPLRVWVGTCSQTQEGAWQRKWKRQQEN